MRGKSAKHHRVWSADSSASQHRYSQLGRHAHVDGNPVALLHTQRLQHICELLHLPMKLLIRKSSHLTRFALPNQCSFIFATGLHMAIKTVVGKIDLSADKPLCPGTLPVEHLVPFFEPVQFAGNAAPEFFRFVDGLAVDPLVIFCALDVRDATKFFRALKLALLLENGINIRVGNGHGCLVSHWSPWV